MSPSTVSVPTPTFTAPDFICPLCQSPLQLSAKTWVCDASQQPPLMADGKTPAKLTQHSFDVARQGYVNLLPVQQKKSKAPGDSPDSIAARQRFLAAGHYAHLQALICEQLTQLPRATVALKEKVAPVIEEQVAGKTAKYWADIGCGEGYYTLAMRQPLAQQGVTGFIAVDISKPAVVTLAKASKAAGCLWQQDTEQTIAHDHCTLYPLVASAAHLPLPPASLNGIATIFSPILPEVFAQMLQPGGWLVIAKPDIGHLASVREALFDSVREHDSDKFLTQLEPYFEQHTVLSCAQDLQLNQTDLADLLTMTPYAYRAQPAKRDAVLTSASAAAFKTEAKFVVYILRKR